ncbi:hypothetical protein L1049_026121 [Liquidambar formosana]|uniref:Protein kinase domain-containing protein n=1 Tax=Liquidambar formosana TaxID=63359 RepID=A0AAP0R655_LIQFO
MEALSAMKDEKRAELGLILRACARQRLRVCRAYGLWYNSDDRSVYLVLEINNGSILEKWGELRNGIVGAEEDGLLNSAIEDGVSSCFAMMGMEICEAVIGLNSEGLIIGCLGLSCFSFDDFGRFYVDLSEVLVTGRKVQRCVAEGVHGGERLVGPEMQLIHSNILKLEAFVSPELLFELLHNEGSLPDCGSLKYTVGYSSDVWSLACILIRLLIGEPFIEEMVSYIHNLLIRKSEENGFDYLGLYKGWMEKVSSLLETKLGTKFVSLQHILCKCLNSDPESRPLVTDVWKCIRELIIKPQFDVMVSFEGALKEENKCCCLVLGKLCQLLKETDKGSETPENR